MNLGPSGPALSGTQQLQIRTAIEAGQVLYKTTAAWTALLTAPPDNAICVETNVSPRKIKIGDGVTLWGALPYAGNEITQAAVLGVIGDGTRIGAEFLPNALSGEGDPNGTLLTVSGATGDGVLCNGTLALQNFLHLGQPIWLEDGPTPKAGIVRVIEGFWVLGVYDGLNLFSPRYSHTLPADTPQEVISWGLLHNGGTGTPLVTGSSLLAADFIGQLYRDTTNNVWYRATSIDPPVWELDAPVSGVGLVVDHTLTSLTGLTNSLASVATLAKTAGEVIGLVVGGVLSFYQLKSSTADQASPGVIRPADYNGSSNQKVWFQVL